MNHSEARQILDGAEAEIVLSEDEGTAKINGEVCIEELQAILQLLEYNS